MVRMEWFQNLTRSIPNIGVMDVIDIAAVAFLIYQVMKLIRTTSASRVAKGIIVLLIITWVTGLVHMYSLNFILSRVISLGFIAVVIMFQPELRRGLEKLGGSSWRSLLEPKTRTTEAEHAIAQVVNTCADLAQEKVGMLLAFERSIPLTEYFKSGTVVDAQPSEELLKNIFFPKAALHDGAVIFRDNRIAAAGCVLPLTTNAHISRELGTRHRAAIGMSEVSDAVVVVVSEETGTISVAVGGMLKRHLTPPTLERLLINELVPEKEDNLADKLFTNIRWPFSKRGEGDDHGPEK